MDHTPLEILEYILSCVGAHTAPSMRLVRRDWKHLIEGIQSLRSTEIALNFPLSYIDWLKSQNLFISMNIIGKYSGLLLPVEWKAEYISPRFRTTTFPEYIAFGIPQLDIIGECCCTRCQRVAKKRIFATFGLKSTR